MVGSKVVKVGVDRGPVGVKCAGAGLGGRGGAVLGLGLCSVHHLSGGLEGGEGGA